MWCTRWFLPLLLLPWPTASPYFLFLFFFSLTLHARPCFYCVILLTALFTSSCYWQPVPTRSLFQAAFPNISPSAPIMYHPNASAVKDDVNPASQLLPVPRYTRLLDRCWCDLSGGHLFDPYNVTHWQLTSLSRALGAAESQRVLVAQEIEVGTESKQTGGVLETPKATTVWVLKTMEKDVPRVEDADRGGYALAGSLVSWFRPSIPLSLLLKSFLHFSFNLDRRKSPDPTEQSPPSSSASDSASAEPPSIRRKYDLRLYGVDLIIDLGWGRES